MARRYNRDSRGRFASGGGGGGSSRPAARGISRGTNRLTRDNSGRITSVGGDGATARGGRLRTASGNQRATQTARISGGRAAGTVTRSGARRTAAAAAVKPAKPQPSASAPKMTRAQYEAAAAKAWGRKPSSSTSKKKQSQDEQLDRLAGLSENRARSRTGLSKSEAMKASDLGKATGRRVEVSQNAFGSYSVRVAGRPTTATTTRAAAAAVKPVRRQPLRGVNAAVASNPAGFKGLPVSLRSRKQAASAQRKRNIGRLRTAENSPSRSFVTSGRGGNREGGQVSVGSMRIRKGRSNQLNLLTGRVESVVSGKRITMSGRSALRRRS